MSHLFHDKSSMIGRYWRVCVTVIGSPYTSALQLSGLLPPSRMSLGSGCPQLHSACCDRLSAVVSHHRKVRERLVALYVLHSDNGDTREADYRGPDSMKARIRSSSPSLSFRWPRPVRAGRRNPARAFRTHQEKDAVIIAGEPALMMACAHPLGKRPLPGARLPGRSSRGSAPRERLDPARPVRTPPGHRSIEPLEASCFCLIPIHL